MAASKPDNEKSFSFILFNPDEDCEDHHKYIDLLEERVARAIETEIDGLVRVVSSTAFFRQKGKVVGYNGFWSGLLKGSKPIHGMFSSKLNVSLFYRKRHKWVGNLVYNNSPSSDPLEALHDVINRQGQWIQYHTIQNIERNGGVVHRVINLNRITTNCFRMRKNLDEQEVMLHLVPTEEDNEDLARHNDSFRPEPETGPHPDVMIFDDVEKVEGVDDKDRLTKQDHIDAETYGIVDDQLNIKKREEKIEELLSQK